MANHYPLIGKKIYNAPQDNDIQALPDQLSLSGDSYGLASKILPGGQDDIGTGADDIRSAGADVSPPAN